jgi:hypothetical protein
MFRSLSIRNFRGFKDLQVQGLNRVNLFLGNNNVGKSALLESVFLLAAPMNAELSLRLNAFRGIDEFHVTEVEELWGWLFYEKDVTRQIVFEFLTENLKHRSLKMRIAERKDSRVQKKGKAGPKAAKRFRWLQSTSKSTIPHELHLDYKTETGATGEARAFFQEGGVAFEHGKVASFPTSIFIPSRGAYAPENAERFSKVQEQMREEELLPALRLIEPRLKKLSLLATGIGNMLHGDIGIGRLVPLPLMGEGLGRLLTLLLAITESKDGVVMIDEIDTGFHYSILSAVWSAITKRAREVDAQIFATTHSWDCLKSAHESFSGSESYDFSLHRLDRDNDLVTSTTYDREMVATALAKGMELR